MDRLQLVSIVGAAVLLIVVLELVRRRRLLERYALLWLGAAAVVLVLAAWSSALERLARALGIIEAPNALFFVALAFIVLLLLHFSAAVSRLSDQSKVLAQRLAIMEHRLGRVEAESPDDELFGEALEVEAEKRLADVSSTRSRG